MAAKRIRLATYCTAKEVHHSNEKKASYQNRAAKSIFIEMLKSKWTGGQDTIRVPIEEFAPVVWMTYLLRTPTNKGNVKRDKKGNKIVDEETKRCIHNTEPAYFTELPEVEKETRCMTVIKHLRKYFKIIDRKTEWTVMHEHFATAQTLSEEVVESILPNRNGASPKKEEVVSPSTTRPKRKRAESEDEESSATTEKNQKRRKTSFDSDISSSLSPNYSTSVVSSPDSNYNTDCPADEDLILSPLTPDTFGDFPIPHPQTTYPMQQLFEELYTFMSSSNSFPNHSQPWED